VARDPSPSGGITECFIWLSPQSPRVRVVWRTVLITRSAGAQYRSAGRVAASPDRRPHRQYVAPSGFEPGYYRIQSRAVRVCLEDTMSVSGCPPSIGARRLGG
jgi:hypothetical protein